MMLYRNIINREITYNEKESNIVNYKYATKKNKHILINFIRSVYPFVEIRDIINDTYKCIIDNGFLVGVQYNMG